METILADIDRLIVPALTHWSHPSFFAYFATSTSAPGIFGFDPDPEEVALMKVAEKSGRIEAARSIERRH